MNEYTPALPQQLAAIAREFYAARDDLSEFATAMSRTAAQLMPATDDVSVVVVNREAIERTGAIDGLAGACDTLQSNLSEGPSLYSAVHNETVLIEDMSADERWPRFARAAATAGVGAMVCVPFEVGAKRMGIVSLCSRTVHGFNQSSQTLSELFTAHAAVAFRAARENEQLHEAIQSRDVIGQAKGMLMERIGVDGEQAFGLLRKLSQDSNVRLAQLAQQVIDAGPGVGPRSETITPRSTDRSTDRSLAVAPIR